MKQYIATFEVDAVNKKNKNKRIVEKVMHNVQAKNDDEAKKGLQKLCKTMQEIEESKRPGYSVTVKLFLLCRLIPAEEGKRPGSSITVKFYRLIPVEL